MFRICCAAEGLPRVRKANVRMQYNVYVDRKSSYANAQQRRVCDLRQINNNIETFER